MRPSTTYKELVRLLTERRVSAAPVVDDQRRVLGLVSEADLLLKYEQPADAFPRFRLESRRHRLERLKAGGGTAIELMTRPVITIGPEAEVAEAARLLRKHLIRRMPVIDSAGRLVGIISRSDVLKTFLRPDSEIRQDIIEHVIGQDLVADPEQIKISVHDG